ncbi:MAG: molybdenum cofactor guanylyltransferase [Ktedonobacteraceae bacterium]
MCDVAGIILAGGQSRRMGRDKALLPLSGAGSTPFVAHLASLLLGACDEVVLVTRDAAQGAAYAPHLSPTVRLVSDEVPAIGPLMGLASGLRAIQSSHALVTAVDTPFLQPALLALLLAQPHDDHLLVPLVEAIPQVLLALYPRTVLPLIEARLREGRRDLRSLLQVARVRYLEESRLRAVDPELRSFVNINTPDEFARTYKGPTGADR